MSVKKYLLGVSVDPFEGLPGVFAGPHHKHTGHYRYLSSYRDGQRGKARIFQLLAQHGQRENPREWELHHIVEGQHFADIDFGGRLERAYVDELPCVLIHRVEHRAYNSLLHIRETDMLYRHTLPRELGERSTAAAAAAKTRTAHARLRRRVSDLRQLYTNAYADDRVLRRIAQNVIDDALTFLR